MPSHTVTPTPEPSVGADRCPVDHTALSRQKTARVQEPVGRPIERDAQGVWHVRGYAEGQAILRGGDTKQAGFKAELIERTPQTMRAPILYQEGQPHQLQRKQTARFFTPRAVGENYRQLMTDLSDRLVAELKQSRRADLSRLSMRMAVQVAAQVVGLTSSIAPGMDRRLNAFFGAMPERRGLRALDTLLRTQWRLLAFFLLDVRPAIRARRRAPREDVISHLIQQGYRDAEILTECVTYGAAGMVTTREFIAVAAWHMLEQSALRARFLQAGADEREAILHEILRVEPVVGHLYRRAVADVSIESDGGTITIPAGDLIDLHIYAANADETVVGAQPLAICPGRALQAERAAPAMLSFGDGHHRCPGAYLAIQETDIFLQRLLALDGLRIEHGPALSWSDLTAGYDLRDFWITLD